MDMLSDEDIMLRRFMEKAKARGQKDYNKHDFLRFIVKTAMRKENMEINNVDLDKKIWKKIDALRKKRIPMLENLQQSKKPKISCQPPLMEKEIYRPILENPQPSNKPKFSSQPPLMEKEAYRPILENPLQSKKPMFSSQPPLVEKKAYNNEVVELEEKKIALISRKIVDDDFDYKKEVMKNKNKNKTKNGKKTTKKVMLQRIKKKVLIPVLPPSEEVCNLMLERIKEVGGTNPVWLTWKNITDSDMRPGLGRLFIPKCEALVNFLTEEEKGIIMDEEKLGIHCNVVDQNGARWNLDFRYWDGPSQYVITNAPMWNQVIKHFGLSLETPGKIELWCFRLPEQNPSFSFAMRVTRL